MGRAISRGYSSCREGGRGWVGAGRRHPLVCLQADNCWSGRQCRLAANTRSPHGAEVMASGGVFSAATGGLLISRTDHSIRC